MSSLLSDEAAVSPLPVASGAIPSAAGCLVSSMPATQQSQLDFLLDHKSADDSSLTLVVTNILSSFIKINFSKINLFILLTTPASQVRQDPEHSTHLGARTSALGTTVTHARLYTVLLLASGREAKMVFTKEEIFMGDRVSKTMEAVALLFYSPDNQHSFDGQDQSKIYSK